MEELEQQEKGGSKGRVSHEEREEEGWERCPAGRVRAQRARSRVQAQNHISAYGVPIHPSTQKSLAV